jgi:hypothetical protein
MKLSVNTDIFIIVIITSFYETPASQLRYIIIIRQSVMCLWWFSVLSEGSHFTVRFWSVALVGWHAGGGCQEITLSI